MRKSSFVYSYLLSFLVYGNWLGLYFTFCRSWVIIDVEISISTFAEGEI